MTVLAYLKGFQADFNILEVPNEGILESEQISSLIMHYTLRGLQGLADLLSSYATSEGDFFSQLICS